MFFFLLLLAITNAYVTTVKTAVPTCTSPIYHEILCRTVSTCPPTTPSRAQTYLDIAELIKVDLNRKFLLNLSRERTTCPAPQIVTLAILVFLRPVQTRSDAPHDEIPQHHHPGERRRHRCRLVRFLNAELVRKHDHNIQQDGNPRNQEVHPCWPDFGILGPGGASFGDAIAGDLVEDVFCGEEFV
jgi:hypothetical protein